MPCFGGADKHALMRFDWAADRLRLDDEIGVATIFNVCPCCGDLLGASVPAHSISDLTRKGWRKAYAPSTSAQRAATSAIVIAMMKRFWVSSR